jgi:hypothetical protein
MQAFTGNAVVEESLRFSETGMSLFDWLTRPAGDLVFRFAQLAPLLQDPPDMMARVVFYDIVRDVWAEHSAQNWQSLPRSALQMLERCLVLVHKDLPRFEHALASTGVSPQKLVDLRREAAADAQCAVRVERAWKIVLTKEQSRRTNRVEIPNGDLIAWMSTQPRSVWHEVATGYNWDLEPERDLGWIVRQPDCDLASALTVFLLGEPTDFMLRETFSDLPDYRLATYEMLDVIATRVLANDYRHRDYGVDDHSVKWWRGVIARLRAEGQHIHRWDFPLDVFDSLKGLPTRAPFTYHDGEVTRASPWH